MIMQEHPKTAPSPRPPGRGASFLSFSYLFSIHLGPRRWRSRTTNPPVVPSARSIMCHHSRAVIECDAGVRSARRLRLPERMGFARQTPAPMIPIFMTHSFLLDSRPAASGLGIVVAGRIQRRVCGLRPIRPCRGLARPRSHSPSFIPCTQRSTNWQMTSDIPPGAD